MADQETMHIGRDGIDLKGYGSILIGVLVLFMIAVVWLFLNYLDREEKRHDLTDGRNALIEQRLESMQRDHATMAKGVDLLAGVMKEQNCILLSDDRDVARIRRASRWSNEACQKIMMEAAR